MKTYSTNLLADVVNIYDKNKTTRAGRVTEKTLPAPYNASPVLGPPLTKFIDTQTDFLATFLPGMMSLTSNERLFILLATPVTGLLNQIAMYTFNTSTGAYAPVGKIAFQTAAATIIARGFKVDDSNTANIKVFLGHTSTSVTTGGLMMINKINLSNFVPSGFITFYTAQSNDIPGVYNLQMPNEVGGAQLMTTLVGVTIPGSSGSTNPLLNTKAFAHNGVSATHQMYVFDYASGPQIASLGTSTVTAGNTTGVNTTFTMVGNTLAVGDQVIITSNAPTGYTVTGLNTIQTLYFVVAANFVAGNTFSLSLTAGGAIVNGSTVQTATTFVRALGQCTNLFVVKTANLPTLGAGTLLTTNSENYCVPSSGGNNGQECVFMSTSTNFFTAKLSELYSTDTGTLNATTSITGLTSTTGLNTGMTVFGAGIPALTTIASIDGPTSITLNNAATTSGATTLTFGASLWPSLQITNVIGSGTDYISTLPVFASYSTVLDKVIYPTTGPMTLFKSFTNSVIDGTFGGTGNFWMEAQNHITDTLRLQAITNFESTNGWQLYSSGTTVGQRGIIVMDLRSDASFNYSYIVTPVISTPGKQTLVNVYSIRQLVGFTGDIVVQYRTAATLGDALFNDATTGWNTISPATNYAIALNNYTQYRVLFKLISSANPSLAAFSSTTPAQIADLRFTTQLLAEISDYWDFSYNDSSSLIPTRFGFAQRALYTTSIPKLYFRAYDVDGNLLTTANTVDNIANFEHSVDDGMTWLPYAPTNAIGTRIRYTHTTPPGVDERVSLLEF